MFMFLTFGGTGLLIAGLGIPLWLRRIPPNHLYGFRSRATLSDETVWYEIWSFSKPASFLAHIGKPIVRTLQNRFLHNSGEAVRVFVHEAKQRREAEAEYISRP